MEAPATACLISIFLVSLSLAVSSVRSASEHIRLVVFRLGRFVDVRGPGMVILIPFIDRAVEVDLREQVQRLNEPFITRDKEQVVVDLIWRFKIFDPAKSVLQVGSLEAAAEGMICTVLRKTLAEMYRADLRMNRRGIAKEVETELSRVMRNWGTELIGVEIQEITVL
jgi:regulator of protease activity HflC (stomatin/prohibitin superfamily)